VSTTTENDPVVESLAAFASLPDWLSAGMDAQRVGASVVRHVPELSQERLQLLSCTPERLRAKGDEWLARYTLEVAESGGAPRHVVLVGNLYGPSQQLPSEDATRADDIPFAAPGWR
jgi:hypothetical protein